MKPDPKYPAHSALRQYVEAVATALGVEPAASFVEDGTAATAYVALADNSPRHPGRLLMLLWDKESGWSLALEPERNEEPVVLAAWPAVPQLAPGELARLVHRTLRPAARGSFPIEPPVTTTVNTALAGPRLSP